MSASSRHSISDVFVFIIRGAKRTALLLIGVALLVGGAIMLVLPGPGLLAILAGLALLATEFLWAQHLLEAMKNRAGQAQDAARRSWPIRHR
ncbi:MAG: hypothetical protein EXQ71_02140 [Acidimicrobiia bacterium]|nr:hypothetical protein [Acidimicrobiia bacterium]